MPYNMLSVLISLLSFLIMQQTRYDYAFKFILVGDTGVGKTSLISRFITGQFSN